MPVSLHRLVGSRRRLFLAVLLFILLDLSVLLINLWIAQRVEQHAIAINLAGRQRMLSQRITKAAILASDVIPRESRANDFQEMLTAFRLFDQTLRAFRDGGVVAGGDTHPVTLARVRDPHGRALIDQTLQLLEPVALTMQTLSRLEAASPEQINDVRDFMVANNQEVLSAMNRLTSVLETESVQSIATLRYVQVGAFSLAMLNFLGIVVGLFKQYQAVERERLHWHLAAQRDALTGLFNRRAFQDFLVNALERASLHQSALVLFVVDLDNFKPINDTYGHSVGDDVLQAVSKVLTTVARDSDTVARLGGDEFAVLCPGMKDEQAINDFCERLFGGLEALQHAPHAISVRASVGAAAYPRAGRDAQTLLNAADAAMYTSKVRGGQHCVQA